ncbi:MAG: outer membrane beta-barrel protein, partial [Rhodospirillaceae bacterium]|nr:outer membrane beta-barrel protein [Rhodospirillaceae bacterium]
MFTTKAKVSLAGAVAAIAIAAPWHTANATNGALPACVGTEKCGMGGAGLTMGAEAISAATNPATAATMGNTAGMSVGWFKANVTRNVTSQYATDDTEQQKSKADQFVYGTMAVNYALSDDIGVNLSIYPGGGGATKWENGNVAQAAGFNNSAGNNSQIRWRMLHIQPSVGYKVNDKASVGAALVISRADMKTDSLGVSFASPGPGEKNKPDRRWGWGFKLGGIYKASDKFSIGANYESTVKYSRFDDYTDPFSTSVNRPETMSAGISFKPMGDATTFAIDGKYVAYSEEQVMGNEPGVADTGGFGWRDQKIIMIGVEHDYDDDLTLRAGFNHGNSPVDEEHVYANVLLPAIGEDHYTVGLTYAMSDEMELGWSAYYSPGKTIK